MLLCTVSFADRAASYASAQANRCQFGLTMPAEWCQQEIENDRVRRQDEANLNSIFSRCSSRNVVLSCSISVSLLCIKL